MSRDRILALLKASGGQPLSGEAIGRELGISRTAVWKGIEALRTEGYEIASAPHRGYTLVRRPDSLRFGEIAGGIRSCSVVGTELVCLASVDSTNTECKRRIAAGAGEGLVIVANEQTGGRGRNGRSFVSPPDSGLYLSAVLMPDVPPVQVIDLTAWTAVAVCDAIEETCGTRPGIKWTNDIVLGGRKVCGILTEMEAEAESGRLRYVIPGIGINCSERDEDFPPEVRPVATSLSQELGKPVDRAALASSLIRALDRMYAAFPAGKDRYLDAYRKSCVTLGHEVRLLSADGSEEEAYAEAIDSRFGLVVRRKDKSRLTVRSGEVSVRGLEGYL